MIERRKKKVDILEKISTSQAVGSSSNVTIGDVVGKNNEDNNKLMTYLNILEKLEGIDATPF